MTFDLALAEIPAPWYLYALHGVNPFWPEPWYCVLRNHELREIATGRGADPVLAIFEAIARIPEAAEEEEVRAYSEPKPRPILEVLGLEQKIVRRRIV